MTSMIRRMAAVPVLALGLLVAVAAEDAAAAKAGPATAKCGKLAKKAKKKRCMKQNQANRAAFNQIKDSRFVGVRGDGAGIEAVYCANGKFESRNSGSSGTGVSTGTAWRISDAIVRQRGKWIDAFLTARGGFEIAIQRRGSQWKIGIASLGRILEPGEMTKTGASADCATLEV